MTKIECNDGVVYVLDRETVEAGGRSCLECGDTAPGDKLFVYSTIRGAKRREHDGVFCNQFCHDVWHGLKSYRGSEV